MSEAKFIVPRFGFMALQTRWDFRDGKHYGQGRTIEYSRDGQIENIGDWTDSGVVVSYPDPEEPQSLWQRLKPYLFG